MLVDLWVILVAMGIPSAITSIGVWYITRTISQSEKKREANEKIKADHQYLRLRAICAALTLSIGTAEVVLGNGEGKEHLKTPLEIANNIQREQDTFFREQGLKNLF